MNRASGTMVNESGYPSGRTRSNMVGGNKYPFPIGSHWYPDAQRRIG